MYNTLRQILRTGILTEAPPLADEALRVIAQRLKTAVPKRFAVALSSRHVDAGSCNGCVLEINAPVNSQYNLNIDVGGTSLGLWRTESREEGEAEAALWERCRQVVAKTSMAARAPFSLFEIRQVLGLLAAPEGGFGEFTTNLKAFSDRVHALAQD